MRPLCDGGRVVMCSVLTRPRAQNSSGLLTFPRPGLDDYPAVKLFRLFAPTVSHGVPVCRWHDEGSTGVENAAPSQVWASIKAARPSYPETRKEFTVKELQDRGLSNTFDAKQVGHTNCCGRLGHWCSHFDSSSAQMDGWMQGCTCNTLCVMLVCRSWVQS